MHGQRISSCDLIGRSCSIFIETQRIFRAIQHDRIAHIAVGCANNKSAEVQRLARIIGKLRGACHANALQNALLNRDRDILCNRRDRRVAGRGIRISNRQRLRAEIGRKEVVRSGGIINHAVDVEHIPARCDRGTQMQGGSCKVCRGVVKEFDGQVCIGPIERISAVLEKCGRGVGGDRQRRHLEIRVYIGIRKGGGGHQYEQHKQAHNECDSTFHSVHILSCMKDILSQKLYMSGIYM